MAVLNSIPVLDLEADVRAELADACQTWGAFQIVGHGVPGEVTAALDAERRRFFALPRPEKQRLLRSAENAWGYYDEELTKRSPDWKEVFDFGHETSASRPDVGDGSNRWPEGLPAFREALLAYLAACDTAAFRLLELLCTSLGVPARRLHAYFEGHHTSFVRLNHYPPSEAGASPDAGTDPGEGHFGVHHHTDAGALTLVEQSEVAGLQVFRDGRWFTVPPVPGALVVNLADMFQVWSNDTYRSPLHRVVVDRTRDRYSAPYFFNPAYDTDCAPLEELVSAARPPRYRTINWGEFRRARATGDYADYGEEVQIDQFAI